MSFGLPFLTLRRHIELCVYTQHAAVHEAQPVRVRSKSQYMGRHKEGTRAMVSGCYGFIELLKRSAILHSWMDWDLLLIEGKTPAFQASLPSSLSVDDHTGNAPSFAAKGRFHIVKVSPSIKVQCQEDIPFVFSAPPFLGQKLSIPSGITDFKYQFCPNFFAYLDSSSKEPWSFKQGDQMLAITAMSDRPLKVHNHYNPKKYLYLHESSAPLSQNNTYIKHRKIMKGLQDV